MVNTTATVLRDGKETELALKLLVPGDIIRLAAGDIAPAFDQSQRDRWEVWRDAVPPRYCSFVPRCER